MLMGKRPHDYDVATSALPEQVVSLFRRTQKVGAKFGVVLVRIGRFAIEVATFRTDLDYEDGRHPTAVRFTNAREDAARRDFTINGMFFDPIAREVVDHVGGRKDLAARVLRAIGNATRRFEEDHLRILRAIRFAARFGFAIERATWSAMSAEAPSLRRISPERVLEELDAILSHPSRARGFADLDASGALRFLWPGAKKLADHADRIRAVLAALPADADFQLAFAALLHPLNTDEVEDACAALRCSNYTKRTVLWLVANQDALAEPAAATLADLKLLMAHQAFEDLLKLFAAKLRAARRPLTPYRRIMSRVRAIPPRDIAPPPFVTGDVLEKLGLPKGPIYKKILDQLYYAQLNGDLRDRPSAISRAKQLVAQATGG